MMNVSWVGAHPANYTRGRQKPVKKIVLHWIGAQGGTAMQMLDSLTATFRNSNRQASVHYGVAEDQIRQYVTEVDTAWHAGDWDINTESIGIEIAGGPNLPISETTYKTVTFLVKDIAERYDIPLDREHIKGHKEVRSTPTECPGTLDIDKVIRMASGDSSTPVPLPPTGEKHTDEEIRALNVLYSAMKTLTAAQGKPFGNVEGLARELVGAYPRYLEVTNPAKFVIMEKAGFDLLVEKAGKIVPSLRNPFFMEVDEFFDMFRNLFKK